MTPEQRAVQASVTGWCGSQWDWSRSPTFRQIWHADWYEIARIAAVDGVTQAAEVSGPLHMIELRYVDQDVGDPLPHAHTRYARFHAHG